jgi:chromosome segregation ATPase
MTTRHTATQSKTLLAQQLNSSRALLTILNQTQAQLAESMKEEEDQDLISATQVLLNSNRKHINLITSEISNVHSTLKNWDQRKTNYQEKKNKIVKVAPTLESHVDSINKAINTKRQRYVNLSEEQRLLKIKKVSLQNSEYSKIQLIVNENKSILNYLSHNILLLKSSYDVAHEAWFQSTKS